MVLEMSQDWIQFLAMVVILARENEEEEFPAETTAFWQRRALAATPQA